MKIVSFAWHAMMGTLDPSKLLDAFFVPNGYTVSLSPSVYPKGIFRKATKTMNTADGKELQIEVIISTRGYLIWSQSMDISGHKFSAFKDLLVTLEGLDISEKSLYEVHVELIYRLFNKRSIVELYSQFLLQDEDLLNDLDNLGITIIHDQIHLNMEHYYLTEDQAEFDLYKKELMQSQLNTVDGIAIPAEKVHHFPGMNSKIFYGSSTLIFSEPKYQSIVQDIHQGLYHYRIGIDLLSSLTYILDTKLYNLVQYIREEEEVSWLYVQETLNELEFKYMEYNQEFKNSFTNIKNFNGINHTDTTFMDTLTPNYALNQSMNQYNNITAQFELKVKLVSEILTDKGEKEGKEATNNLIQLIGILAILEVVSGFLPVLPDTYLDWIRLSVLIVIFPLLALVWYRTQWRTRSKKLRADKFKQLVERKDLIQTLSSYKNVLQQQLQSDSGEFLNNMYSKEIQKIDAALTNMSTGK